MQVAVEGGTGLVKQGTRKLDYILAWCMEAYRYSRDRHEQNWCRDSLTFYSLYRNFARGGLDPDDFTPSVTLGLAFPLVKILSARLAAPWQAGDRLMECLPNDGMSSSKAPLIASYVNDVLVNKIPRSFSKLELIKESACALGRGVAKTLVKKTPPTTVPTRQQITMPVPMEGYPAGIPISSYIAYTQKPGSSIMTFDYVDPFQFWYMGTDRWASGAEQTFEVAYLTPTEVAQRVESGEFNQKFQYSKGNALGYDQWYERRRSMDGGFGDNVRAGAPGPKPHRYLEIQGLVETRTRENGLPVFEQCIVGILDERDIVKYDKLGTWDGKPGYIVWELFQDIAQERAQGLVEPCQQVLFTIDDFVSIALDNARKIIESPLAVDDTATEQTEIYLGSGAVNWIRNPGASIKPIEMKDLPRSFFDLLVMLNETLYRVTGMSDLIGQGVATQNQAQGADTARGMAMMANLATSRLSPILTKMDMELYRPLAMWIHETGRLRMDEDQYVRMAGGGASQFQLLTPDALDADVGFAFNVKALDAATGSRRQEYLQMLEILLNPVNVQGLAQQGMYIDAMEVSRLLLSEFGRSLEAPQLIKQLGAAPQMPQAQAPGPAGPFALPGQASAPGAPQAAGGQVPDGALPPLPSAA
jgi:hypothetical protein